MLMHSQSNFASKKKQGKMKSISAEVLIAKSKLEVLSFNQTAGNDKNFDRLEASEIDLKFCSEQKVW